MDVPAITQTRCGQRDPLMHRATASDALPLLAGGLARRVTAAAKPRDWALAAFVCLVCCLVSSLTFAEAPQTQPAREAQHAHKKAPGAGIASLDVFAENGRTHLLLVQRETEDQPPIPQYLRSDDGGVKWTDPQPIVLPDLPPPVGAHRGLDVQLTAHGDRVIAAWTIYSAEHRFGRGKIATAVSSDGGRTWRLGANPADDNSEGDHAFLDLASDDRGNFHAAWLDSRAGKKGLIYANSSDGGVTWSRNVVLDPESCECCWNMITVAGDRVMVLYRNKGPRDMAMICSDDAGKTWGSAVTVGQFDWEFNGCPHVGGGLSTSKGESALNVFATVWTGKPEIVGSYMLASPDGGKTWASPVRFGDATAGRPDIAANGRKVAAVWDMQVDGQTAIFAAKSGDWGKTWSSPVRLSSANVTASHPRIVPACEGFQAFWTERSEGKPDAWQAGKL